MDVLTVKGLEMDAVYRVRQEEEPGGLLLPRIALGSSAVSERPSPAHENHGGRGEDE